MKIGFITRTLGSFKQALRRSLRRRQTLKPTVHWVLGKRYQAHLEVAEWRSRLGAKIAGSESFDRPNAVNPENMIWVFGIGRSGNTWLLDMVRGVGNHQTWDEPYVGRLFGEFYLQHATAGTLSRVNFIMGDPTRKGWTKSIRNFVLDGASYSHPRLGPGDYLVIGEHNSSVGAPLLMEALPESRMILLVRDPRDVIASNLDGARKGGWLHQWREKGEEEYHALAEKKPNVYVQELAEKYLHEVGLAKQAYDSHKGRKVLVRYEDLRADTLSTMQRIYSTLEIPVNDEKLAQVVAKYSWENVPEKDKGKGKFTRKATPGGWKEDLTTEQARIIEEETAPLLREFYYAASANSDSSER